MVHALTWMEFGAHNIERIVEPSDDNPAYHEGTMRGMACS